MTLLVIICLTTITVVFGQGFFPHRPAIKNADYDDLNFSQSPFFQSPNHGLSNQFGFEHRPWPPLPPPPPTFHQSRPSIGFNFNFFRKNDQEIQVQDDLISNGIREAKSMNDPPKNPHERPELTRTLRFPSRYSTKKRPTGLGRPSAIKNSDIESAKRNPDFAIRVSQQHKPAIKLPDFSPKRNSQFHQKPTAAIKIPENIRPIRRNIFSATKNSNSEISAPAIKITDLQISSTDQSQPGIKNSPGFFKSI